MNHPICVFVTWHSQIEEMTAVEFSIRKAGEATTISFTTEGVWSSPELHRWGVSCRQSKVDQSKVQATKATSSKCSTRHRGHHVKKTGLGLQNSQGLGNAACDAPPERSCWSRIAGEPGQILLNLKPCATNLNDFESFVSNVSKSW